MVATWPRPSSCTSSWSPPSPSSRSPSATLLSLSLLSPGWSAAAAASIALLVSYHRLVRRSLQGVTHQCHFTGTRGRVCSGRDWTLVAYDCQSPELRYITIRCGARDSNVTVLPICTILRFVHCDVLCCKFQTPLCCLQLFSDLVWISRKPVRKSIITIEKIFLPR